MLGRSRPAGFDSLDSQARFELVARLGDGAHGEVFEAIDRARGTRVAIKALRDTSPQGILRFKREFRSLAELHHENLVEFGELFEDAGRWFFSMELVHGQDFVSHVRSPTTDPSEVVERLTRALHQLGSGLSALHRAGKIHRDIKPSNIRVQPDGRVVLLDFGLVRPSVHDSTSDVERVVGSVGYMAPEQASARPLSAAADCYAVGVLMYEALTGEQPFSGTVIEVLLAKQARPVLLPPALCAQLPQELVALCHALCRIDPSQRATVDDLIAHTARAASEPSKKARISLRASDIAATTSTYVGRDAELELLERAFETACAGTLSKVRVSGASGVGKTALLRAFRERLARRGEPLYVLNGSCNEQERVTHNAFDAAIDELGQKVERSSREQCARLAPKYVTALVNVFPVLARLLTCSDGSARSLPPDPITLRRHAYAGLRDLLHRMSERAPVVLILDDLHWADAESMALLEALTRPPDPPPLLLVASTWPAEECSSQLRTLAERTFGGGDTLELFLGALPSAEAIELARQLLSAADAQPDVDAAERIAHSAACHPLFIEVLARSRNVTSAHAQLEETLWREMTALSPRAHQLLQLIAVAGTAIPEPILAAASGLGAEALTDALAELRWSKLVRSHALADGFSVGVYHVKIRSALLAHVDDAALTRHHLALAHALARGPCRDPEALALHWLGAGQPGKAAACFAQAATAALQARAFAHAAQLYRSALAADAGQRRPWLQALALAEVQAGRSAEAAEAFVAAAEGCALEQTRELRLRAAEHYLRAGKIHEGFGIARPLLAEIGETLAHSDTGAAASLIWQRTRLELRGTRMPTRAPSAGSDGEREACDMLWSISLPLLSLDFVRGLDLHYRCFLRALRLGDAKRVARSLSMHSLYMKADNADGELRVRGLLATADTLARRENDPYLIAFNQMCHSTFQLLNGEPTSALALAESAATLFEEQCSNAAWEIVAARASVLTALSLLGRFNELNVRFEAASAEAKERGNLLGFTTLVTLNRCTIDLAADRVDSCRAHLQHLMQSCPADWHLQHAFALGAQVLLDLYEGGDAALQRLSGGWQGLRHHLILTSARFRIFFVFAHGLAALAALLTGDRDRQARIKLVRRCADRLAGERIADAKGGAHILRGQLASLHGDLTTATAEYRAGIAVWGRVGMYGAKIAGLRLGEIVGGEEGAALIADCMRWARDEGIRRPDRFFRVWLPATVSDRI